MLIVHKCWFMGSLFHGTAVSKTLVRTKLLHGSPHKLIPWINCIMWREVRYGGINLHDRIGFW